MELKVKWWIHVRVCISVHINTKKKEYLRAAPYVVLILQSYRWSKIVLLLRKTFRHLFLSELGLQLYLSLNNLPLPPRNHLFLLFFSSTALHLSCSKVAGIKGVFLSNKVVENQVKTYITYNKGRDWRLLQAPTTDLQGNKIYCEQVSGPLTRDALGYLGLHYLP